MDQTKKHEVLVAAFAYARLYLEGRIADVGREDFKAAYKVDLENMNALYLELFTKSFNGEL